MRVLPACVVVCALALSNGCRTDDVKPATGSGTSVTTVSGTSTGTTAAATTSATSATSFTTSTTAPSTTTMAETTGRTTADGSTGEPPGQRVLLAVGYGGMRVRSLDDGLTWQDYTQLGDAGGDDFDLLRGAVWGQGRFVAAGWRIFSSEDGAQWTEHENPTGQWLGAVAYGNDMFLGVGGGGYCARSDDGQQWEVCTDATDDGGFTHVRSVVFYDGLFWAADGNGVLRSSPDGDVWTVQQNIGSPWIAVVDGEIVALEESAPAQLGDVRLRGGNESIQRADPGTDVFATVFEIPNGNNVFGAYRFAFADGVIAP